jgi:hypothetical protein
MTFGFRHTEAEALAWYRNRHLTMAHGDLRETVDALELYRARIRGLTDLLDSQLIGGDIVLNRLSDIESDFVADIRRAYERTRAVSDAA